MMVLYFSRWVLVPGYTWPVPVTLKQCDYNKKIPNNIYFTECWKVPVSQRETYKTTVHKIAKNNTYQPTAARYNTDFFKLSTQIQCGGSGMFYPGS
jgi:hypothetical protein